MNWITFLEGFPAVLVALGTFIATVLSAWKAFQASAKTDELHLKVNGRLDDLIAAKVDAATANARRRTRKGPSTPASKPKPPPIPPEGPMSADA